MVNVKYIYDEVHGYVPLSGVELRLVDTPTFQRLRRIKQLAQAWLVYPGAVHTRFSHSLGAMYLMDMIACKFVKLGIIPKDDVELLKVAALLHDVGHTPYSHAIEEYFYRRFGVSHEDISYWIVTEDPHIRDVLNDYGLEPREVAAIIQGRHREVTYNMLVSSDLDVDRLDYLLRDALHTGVKYGLIDLHRIVATLGVNDDGYITVPEKAVQAAESFYIARLHMYRSVYYHKTITSYQLLINAIYEGMACEDSLKQLLSPFSTAEGVRKAVKSGKIFLWDDFLVGGAMNYALIQNLCGRELKQLLMAYLGREGYRTVIDRTYFTNDRSSLMGCISRVAEEISRALRDEGVPQTEAKVYFRAVPVVTEECVHVALSGRGSVPITDFGPSIIKALPKYMIVLRVYSLPRKAEFVKRLVADLLNHYEGV